MPKSDSPATHQPRKVGRYLLHREIAHGGMATVHIGRLLGQVGFSRTIAIKRMHEHCARDPDFVSMFIDEARLAARIRHPNVVPTLDVVVLDAELFLVMEYVQGETLARLIRRSFKSNIRIAPRIASSVIAGALEGLNAAHEAVGEHGEALGIVHRDVSPHNIMVGNDGVSRVLDFGVAKATNRLQTTRNGQIKGKVEYMAPEQLRGSLVDRRTDVYAAACCLWEMLTGRRLYTADNPVALWGKVLEGNPEPPSKVVPEVPPELDEITMRGLEPDPTKRYQTAEDMAIALEQMVGIATPREVGRWVETLAGKKLRERSSMIAELDSIASDISWSAEDAASDISSVVSQVSSKHAAPTAEPSEPPVPSGVKPSPVAARIPRPSSSGVAAVPTKGMVPAPPPSALRPAVAPSIAKPTIPKPIPKPIAKSSSPQPTPAKPSSLQPIAKSSSPQPTPAKPSIPQPAPAKPSIPQLTSAKPSPQSSIPQPTPAKPSIPQPTSVKPSPPSSIPQPIPAPVDVVSESKPVASPPVAVEPVRPDVPEANLANSPAEPPNVAPVVEPVVAPAVDEVPVAAPILEHVVAPEPAVVAPNVDAAAEALNSEVPLIEPPVIEPPVMAPMPPAVERPRSSPVTESELDAGALLGLPGPAAEPVAELEPLLPMRKGPPLALIAAGVAVVILVVAGALLFASGSSPEPAAIPAASATAPPAPEPTPEVTASATASAQVPAPPKKVSLRIVVTPPTATILIDGQQIDERELEIGVSSDPVVVSAQAPGYETLERQFVPTTNGSVVFELKRRVVNTKPTATVEIKGPVETEL